MRRTELRRNTPLRPGKRSEKPRKPIERRARVKAINPKRAAKKHERNFKHAEKIRMLPCLVCGIWATEERPNQSAHVSARGMGGCKGSYKDQVPMCDAHHKEYDAGPETWAAKHPEIDLRKIADTLAEIYDNGGTADESVFVHWQLDAGCRAALDA